VIDSHDDAVDGGKEGSRGGADDTSHGAAVVGGRIVPDDVLTMGEAWGLGRHGTTSKPFTPGTRIYGVGGGPGLALGIRG
jgi:hypothetical protein